ncbi:MAG: efflux RND transporter permease subunit [Verrucomicrobiota bacterium]
MNRVLHWFRRDLRLSDNTALSAASRQAEGVIPVYVLSEWNQAHRWTGASRQQFLCGCLASLEKNLLSIGGRLIIRQGDPVAELERLVTESKAEAIYFNRDPDPHGRETERRLAVMCGKLGILLRDFKDVCVHERDEILTGNGDPFRVFTPYLRAWHKVPRPPMSKRPVRLATPSEIASLPLPSLKTWNLSGAAPQISEPGEMAARKRLSRFLSEGLPVYGDARNFPGETSTSRLSQDLRFGLLSIREVVEAVEKNNANAGGGVLVRDWEQVYLRGVGLLKDATDIERIVLKAHEGAPVYVRDVADVVIGSEPRQGAVTRDGKGEAVAGMVIMLKGENSKDVVERTKEAIAKVQGSIPEGVRLSVFYDRTSLIQACIKTVMDALLEGGILVILVLFLFLAAVSSAKTAAGRTAFVLCNLGDHDGRILFI